MRYLYVFIVLQLAITRCQQDITQQETDNQQAHLLENENYFKTIEKEILYHGEVIRKAFSKGEIETIKSVHHPDVIKALGYNDIKTGREEVISGLVGTLENYNLEFVKNEVESILVNGDIAIEQTKFSIKGTSKKGGESFIFSGRTMVTYIRYDKSSTG